MDTLLSISMGFGLEINEYEYPQLKETQQLDDIDTGGALVRLVYNLMKLYVDTQAEDYRYMLGVQDW